MKRSIKKLPRIRSTKKEVEKRKDRIDVLSNFMNEYEIAKLLKIDRTTVIYYQNKRN